MTDDYGTRMLNRQLKVLERRFKPKRVAMQKRSQPWTWAYNHSNRVTKHWNWRLVTAMNGVEHHSCVPFALYKWKAFGFDGGHKPAWTIADYIKGGA